MVSTETKQRILKILLKTVPFTVVIIMLLIIAYLIWLLVEVSLPVPLTILTNFINSIPINSGDAYPILLQGIIIAASMLFGFYTFLLFEFVKCINGFLNKYISEDISYFRIVFKAFVIFIAILPISFLLLSIFSAFYSTMFYGLTLTYTTEQISTNSIPANVSNIWNSTYFEQIKNYRDAGPTAYHYYQSLNANTKASIKALSYAGLIIISVLLFYMLMIFEFFEYLADKLNKHPFIGSFIILGIFALLFYLLKLYLAFYLIVTVAIVILILLVYSRKVQKGNKKTL